ncbi:uncharacterized protein [Argopecten irradians]|uniref:uncharacterized protein isoform X2 n=1 Tax=Argopecten irradians TaxID=31199 RepID=UPI003717EC04
MSAIYGQDPLSPFARSPGCADNHLWSPRLKPRWGEYDVITHDGLSRFKSNFDCCHQGEVRGSHDPIDTFCCNRLPKPLEADYTGMVTPKKTDRHVACDPQVDVFPLHDRTRKDENGEYVLPSSTRAAIESTHNKLYCSSSYQSTFQGGATSVCCPEQTLCDDQEVPEGYYPTEYPVFCCQDPYDKQGPCNEMVDNLAYVPSECNYDASNITESGYEPSFFSPMAYQRRALSDANQNFHDRLVQDVYHYRLPSSLHYPEGFEEYDQLVPCTMDVQEKEQEQADIPHPTSKFLRPVIPPTLIRDMVDLKMEMDLAKKVQSLPEIETPSRKQLPSIEEWTEWPHKPKVSRPQRSETQKRFNIYHPTTIPDLRDFKVYSKRVYFNGFNSSAFRG